MEWKKKINKFICVFCSYLILVFGLLQSSIFCVNSYANSSSGSIMTVDQYLRSINFYDACAYAYRSIGAIPDNIGGGSVTFALFEQYLADQDKEELLQEPVTVVEGASGGRGYEVPQDVRQEMINFINTNIVEATPLSYVQCYIHSYNFLDPTQFSQYSTFKSVQEIIKNCNGYAFMWVPNGFGTGNQNNMYICTIDQSQYTVNFIGTTNNGIFSNVTLEHNWSTVTNIWSGTGVTWYMCRLGTGGRIGRGTNPQEAANDAGYSSSYNPAFSSIYNGSGPAQNKCVVMTHLDKDELVYVFNTLSAYKNYNAGTPQPYYLLSDPNYIAPYNDVWTNEGLTGAGNFYNNIVNNVSTGSTPNQIQDTTRDILNGVTGGNSGSSDNGFDLGFLGTIGEVIKSVTGAFTPVNSLISGDLSTFISDVFGWLPQEIVILWVAGIIFAVLFGILKLIRG